MTTHWENLVGTTLGPTEWFEIDQTRIDAFADVTVDHQSIHVDPEAASTKALGGTIAHGFLGLSLLSHFSEQLFKPHTNGKVVLNYGLDRVRFITPIPAAAKIRMTAKITEAQAKPQGTLVSYESQVDLEHHQSPAFIAQQLVLILS